MLPNLCLHNLRSCKIINLVIYSIYTRVEHTKKKITKNTWQDIFGKSVHGFRLQLVSFGANLPRQISVVKQVQSNAKWLKTK